MSVEDKIEMLRSRIKTLVRQGEYQLAEEYKSRLNALWQQLIKGV